MLIRKKFTGILTQYHSIDDDVVFIGINCRGVFKYFYLNAPTNAFVSYEFIYKYHPQYEYHQLKSGVIESLKEWGLEC